MHTQNYITESINTLHLLLSSNETGTNYNLKGTYMYMYCHYLPTSWVYDQMQKLIIRGLKENNTQIFNMPTKIS